MMAPARAAVVVGVENQIKPDGDHWQAQHLPAGHPAESVKANVAVGLSEKFGKKSQATVADAKPRMVRGDKVMVRGIKVS